MMTATRKRTKTGPSSENTPPEQGKSGDENGASRGVSGAKRGSAGRPRAAKGTKPTDGAKLRADLAKPGDTVSRTILIRQAERIADRLEQIHQLLSGSADAWLSISLPRSDAKRGRVVLEVRVDGLVVEERNQTTLLRHLLADIDRTGPPAGPRADDDDDLVE